MRRLSRILSLAVLLVAATTAWAESELVMLDDGQSGMGEVVSTDAESITVKFTTEAGGAGETTLRASRLDPHSFYGIRSKHMEKTAENHVRLAIYCAETGLFNRAKIEMEAARKLDPEIDKKIDTPEIQEKIVKRLAQSAKDAFEKGDLDLCRELAHLIATRFHESSLADEALEACELIDAEIAKRDAGEVAAREKKIAEAADDAAKKAAESRHKTMTPIEKRQEAGRKKTASGLRAKNRSTARRSFEAAAADFAAALKSVEGARKGAAGDAELGTMLDAIESELRGEAVNAWVNAGSIDLWRESFNNAMEAADKAVEVDPTSSAATSFKKKVEFAYMVRDTDRRR